MDRRRQRLFVAAVAALAIHALVLVAITLLPRARRAAPPPRVLQLDLRKIEPEGGAPDHVEKGPPQRGVSREAAPREGVAPAPARPPAAGEKAEPVPQPWSHDWSVAEGVSRPGGGASLRLEHPENLLDPGGGPAERLPGPVREKSREEKLAEEKAVVAGRIHGWVSDLKAKERAENRDGYWQAVQDALGRGFEPGWDVLDQGPTKAPRSTLGALFQGWKKQAAAYGKTGNPFAGSPDVPGARKPLGEEFLELANEDRGLGSVSLGRSLNFLGVLSAAAGASGQLWHYRLTASVRITLQEDGSLLAVELLDTSGNASYDRLALRQARSLGTLQLGPPRQGRETLWAFETDFSQIPPLPIAGCALDDFIPRSCFYPLQKRARSRVRLLTIY